MIHSGGRRKDFAVEDHINLDSESVSNSRLDKRARIAEAAAACFLRRGFAETSLDEIVLESGVVKQTLYNHFDSKDALFKAAIEHLLAATRSEFDPLWLKLSPQDFFSKMGVQLLDIMSEQTTTAFLRLLVKECRKFPELQQIYAKSMPEPFIDFVSSYIAAQVKNDSLLESTKNGFRATAWYFRSAITGFATLSNLAPLLSYTLPERQQYLNLVSKLFACFLELKNNEALALASETPSTVPHETSIRDLFSSSVHQLGEKKLSIIQAAIHVLSSKGFAETSMDEVAAQANASKQTVYKHCSNKSLMYGLIAKTVLEQLRLGHLPSDELPLSEYLSELCSNLILQAKQPWLREYFRLVFGESQSFPLESGTFLIYVMDFGRDKLEAKIRQTYGENIDSLSLSIAFRSMTGGFILLNQIFIMGDNPFLSEQTLGFLDRNLLACIKP